MEDKDEEVVQDVVQRDKETENKKEEVYMVPTSAWERSAACENTYVSAHITEGKGEQEKEEES